MKIQEIDRNFVAKQVDENGIRWIDAFSSEVALRGLAWLEENRAARSFRRCPERAACTLSPAVQNLTRCPSSAFVAFQTDSGAINVRIRNANLNVMQHMPRTGSAGAELYVRDGNRWVPIAVAVPDGEQVEFQRELVKGNWREMREYRLYLPLYMHLEELAIGVEDGAAITPAPVPEGQKPIFFYGTSITQGGCANTAGSDYVSVVGRLLESEVINFGFSGSGKGEPEVAQLIREIDAEMFVLDYAANASPELLAQTLPPFVQILREKHPDTPIVLMGPIGKDRTLRDVEYEGTFDARRDVTMEYYLRAKAAGDASIYFIDGLGLVQPGSVGLYCDGVHPTSAGFVQMAERLAPHLAAIRLWRRQRAASEAAS